MPKPRRVLVAFDKFKDALTAERACGIAARELRRAHPDWLVETAPLTDGGEGFCRILTDAAGGECVALMASGPRMERLSAPIGLVELARLPASARQLVAGHDDELAPAGRLAVIEMAAINGLALVPPAARDPQHTTTFGTGQLIRAAAELGAARILLGIGGSATSDLGLGALNALGFEFRSHDGAKIRPPFPALWPAIEHIEGEVFASVPPIAVACDVTNPLLGPNGAAAVYGRQKGLRPEKLDEHEREAERLARLLCAHCGKAPEPSFSEPGAGAAGGIGFGLRVAARARLVPGFRLIAYWLGLEEAIARADLVITGEGRFDSTSGSGKGPDALVQRARALGKPTVGFAGVVAVAPETAAASGAEWIAVTPEGTPLDEALASCDRHLAAAIARRFGHST